MPAVNELQAEALKWQRRISMIQGRGLNPSPVTELAKTDMQRLASGGSPYPEQQYISMIYSAYTGQVTTPPSHTADWNPLELVNQVKNDISTDVRSFLPGLVHEAADMINPNKWNELGDRLSKFKIGDPSTMAKEIRALPIVGPLVPGTFAASASWKDIAEHPLNYALDVFAIAAPTGQLAAMPFEVGDSAALSFLQEGHPLKAVADATGVRAYVDRSIASLPGPLAEFANMPVWRKLSDLTRVYNRKYAEGSLAELQNMGLISKTMSTDEAAQLAYDALHFDKRYEQPASAIDAQQVANAQGDVNALTSATSSEDVAAYTVGTAMPLASDTIFFTPEDALKSVASTAKAAGLDPQSLIQKVRVNKHAITSDHKGNYKGTGMVPFNNRDGTPIFYSTKKSQQLQNIRTYVNKHRSPREINRLAKQKQVAHDLVVLPGKHGQPMTYRRDSIPARAHEKLHAEATHINSLSRKNQRDQAALQRAAMEAQGLLQEHYARFGESAADAAARSATYPTLVNLANAMESFVQNGKKGANRVAYDALEKALMTKNFDKIEATLRGIKLREAKDPTHMAERSYADYALNQMKSLRTRERHARSIFSQLKRGELAKKESAARWINATTSYKAAEKDFYDKLAANPVDESYQLIDEQIRGQLQQNNLRQYLADVNAIQSKTATGSLKAKVQVAGATTAISQLRQAYEMLNSRIEQAGSRAEMVQAVGTDTLKPVEETALKDWAQMQQAGYDPIWLSQVDASHYEDFAYRSIRPLPDRPYIPEQEINRIFDFSGPGVLDIRMQLTHMAAEWLRQEATDQFTNWLINDSKVIVKRSALVDDMTKRYKDPALIRDHLKEEYAPFDAKKFTGHDMGLDPGDEWMIPRGVAEGFDRLMKGNRLPFAKVTDPLHRVFKFSVLTGPRHFVHVAVGGLVMMNLAEPGATLELLKRPVDIIKYARTGEWSPEIEAAIGKQRLAQLGDIRKGNYEERIDEFMDISDRVMQHNAGVGIGRIIGGWWRKSSAREGIVSATQKLNNFENVITDMYRTATLLDQIKHKATNEEAMAAVNKIFIDVDNLTPWERSSLRQIFPFWTFTKHILRYVLTYPSDHPLRASILAHLAQQIEEDQGSGDPARLSKLFMLGTPDALGNIQTVDISNANPFRSMASIFSMQGFFQGLAPELQVGLKAGFGFDPITGLPTFRPHLTYDAYSGTNKAQAEPLSIFDFAGAFIPQIDVIDHYMLFTNQMRQLRKTNPEAYTRSLFQALNLPFIVAPINVNDVRAKAAAAQYVDASQAVADALRTGNTDTLLRFVAVPFEGQLYDSQQVANYIDNFHRLFPQFAPKAIMKKPRRRKTQL